MLLDETNPRVTPSTRKMTIFLQQHVAKSFIPLTPYQLANHDIFNNFNVTFIHLKS